MRVNFNVLILENPRPEIELSSQRPRTATGSGRNGNEPSPVPLQKHSLGVYTIDSTPTNGAYRGATRYFVSNAEFSFYRTEKTDQYVFPLM